ncbi:MAG: hypothetical protein IKU56_00390 [Clostridia bacterium]|nr:hypothetical protein [Clostridia bacterium]
MYSIVKNVIGRGGFDLSALIQKIDTLWVQGSLTDEQREELVSFARSDAKKHDSVDVAAKLEELDRRVAALEKAGATEESGEEYPDFVVGKWYYTGDTCTFDGNRYTCTAPGDVACVWSPADYPAYWELVN